MSNQRLICIVRRTGIADSPSELEVLGRKNLALRHGDDKSSADLIFSQNGKSVAFVFAQNKEALGNRLPTLQRSFKNAFVLYPAWTLKPQDVASYAMGDCHFPLLSYSTEDSSFADRAYSLATAWFITLDKRERFHQEQQETVQLPEVIQMVFGSSLKGLAEIGSLEQIATMPLDTIIKAVPSSDKESVEKVLQVLLQH